MNDQAQMQGTAHPIPYGRHEVTAEDIAAVTAVLQSERLTQGPQVPAFEEAFADYVGAPHAVAVANGTAALHVSALALGLSAGQRVITSPLTFVATANCARYCGAEVVFADIDPETYLIDLAQVAQLLTSAPRGYYAGIIPVDFAGRAVDMEKLRDLADAHGCWMLEDACHAPGGYFRNSAGTPRYCGSGEFADAAIFSFHPVKHIAAGEGGMVTTRHAHVAERCRALRTHGIQHDPARCRDAHGVWYYEMQELGFNYRLTDIQAALGHSQLQRAQAGVKRRRQLAARYHAAFAGQPFLTQPTRDVDGHAYHLFVLTVHDRDGLMNHLRAHNIGAQVHYIPVHYMPYYRQFGWKPGDFPHTEQVYRHALSLPLYPALTDDEQATVIETVFAYYGVSSATEAKCQPVTKDPWENTLPDPTASPMDLQEAPL